MLKQWLPVILLFLNNALSHPRTYFQKGFWNTWTGHEQNKYIYKFDTDTNTQGVYTTHCLVYMAGQHQRKMSNKLK